MAHHDQVSQLERALSLVLVVCYVVVAVDSRRVPYTDNVLWLGLYAPGIVAAAWWAFTVRLTALQLMVVFLALPGFARAVLYLLGPEQRLVPFGLNGAIAALLLMYHRARRLEAR